MSCKTVQGVGTLKAECTHAILKGKKIKKYENEDFYPNKSAHSLEDIAGLEEKLSFSLCKILSKFRSNFNSFNITSAHSHSHFFL